MPTRVYDVAVHSGSTSNATVTYTTHVSKSVTLDNAATYLVIGYCETQVNNLASADTIVALVNITDAATLDEVNAEIIVTDGTEWIPTNVWAVVTGTGAAKTFGIQHRMESAGGGRASGCRNGRIVFLKLEATDVAFENNVTATSAANPGAWTTYAPASGTAALTFTPPSTGDYLILTKVTSTFSLVTNGWAVGVRVEDGSTVVAQQRFAVTDISTERTYASVVKRTGLTNSAQTFNPVAARGVSGSGTVTFQRVVMCALRLDGFTSASSAEDLVDDTMTSATLTDLGDTKSDTLASGDDYLYLIDSFSEVSATGATASIDALVNSTTVAQMRYRTGVAARGHCAVVAHIATGAGASVTAKIQGASNGSATLTQTEHRIHVLALEGVTNVTVDLVPATAAASAIAATVAAGAVAVNLAAATASATAQAFTVAVVVAVNLASATATAAAQAVTVTPGAVAVTLVPVEAGLLVDENGDPVVDENGDPLFDGTGPVASAVPLQPSTAQAASLNAATATSEAQPFTVTAGAVALTLTPATATATAQPLAVSNVPPAGSVNLTPATAAATAQSLTVTAGPATVAATTATATAAAVALTPVPGAVTVNLTAATATATAPALVISTVTTVALAPATATATAQSFTVTAGPAAVDLTPATAAAVAQPLAIAGVTAVNLTAATATSTARALTVSTGPVTVALTPATATATATPFTIGSVTTVELVAAVAAASARPLTVTAGPATVDLTSSVAASTAQPLAITVGPTAVNLAAATAAAAAVILTVAAPPPVLLAERTEQREPDPTTDSQLADPTTDSRRPGPTVTARADASTSSRRPDPNTSTRRPVSV